MSATTIYLLGLAAAVGSMTLLWLISLPLRNASIVDSYWGPGFGLVALVYLSAADAGPRGWLVLALTLAWGLRLGVHIFVRNFGKPEDYRYAAWRRGAGARFWWFSYFQVFLLQGLLLWLISAPLLAAQLGRAPLGGMDALAAAAWAVGFFFEAVGDWQLLRFKADAANRGQVMDRGLWRYTRHPNYFGEAAMWVGYGLFAVAAGGWWSLYGPALMIFLLLRVSGVALLEKGLASTKPGYAEYVARTSAFIPMPPRKIS
jgi:steroid 5-alpha reductase family enzyme